LIVLIAYIGGYMAIKQEYALTRAEFDEALVRLRLNVSEVAKETGIPRSYCSEFRNGDRQLRPEQLAKLKDYFENKGLVFENNAPESEQPSLIPTVADLANPEGVQHTLLAVRHLAIDQSLNNEQVTNILKKVAANDHEAELLLNEKVERGILSDWSELTDSYLKQVFGLFAANYVLMRHLQGRPLVVLEKPVAYDDVDTVAALFSHLFHEENGELVSRDHTQDEPLEADGVQP